MIHLSNYSADKRKSVQKSAKNDDRMVNRMMAVFAMALVLIVALLLLKKQGSSVETRFVLHVLPYIKAVTGLLFAGMVAFFLINRGRHTDESGWFFNTTHFVIFSFILFLSALLYSYIGNKGVVLGIVALLVSAFVYCFYQRDFFLYTLFTILGAFGLYAIRSGYSASVLKYVFVIILEVVAFVLPVVTVIVMLIAQKNDGCITLFGKKITLMKPKSLYPVFYIGAAVLLIAAVLSFFINAIALYTLLAFLALYLVIAIVYTVRMM